MQNVAAGLLMYRQINDHPEFFLVHPGGPYFRKRNTGAWSIPKGLREEGEDLLETAQREFLEETGIKPTGPFHSLNSVRHKGGKIVHAWAFEGSWNPDEGITCNTFFLEWPPRSGKKVNFPEVDDAGWFELQTAFDMIIPEQIPFLKRALEIFKKGKTENHRTSV